MPLPIDAPDESQLPPNPENIPSPLSGFSGRLEQFKIGVEQGFEQGSLGFDLALQATNKYNPGPMANPSEVPDSLKKKYPNGIGKNTLTLIEKENQLNNEQQELLSQATPGSLTSAINFSSSTIGTILQPKNAAAGWFSEAAMPAKLFGIAKGAELTKAAIRTRSAIRGAVIGEAINSELNLSHYIYNQELGNDQPLSLLDGSFEAGIGGGILGGIFTGHYNKMASDHQAPKEVMNTGVSQLVGDKNINIDPLVRKSVADTAEAMRSEGTTEDGVSDLRNEFQSQMNNVEQQIKSYPKDPDISPLLGSHRLNKVLENIYKPGKQSSSDLRFNEEVQSVEPYEQLTDLSTQLPHLRSDVSRDALNAFYDDPQAESRVVNKNLSEKEDAMNKLQSQVEDLDHRISKTDNPELKQDRLNKIESIRGLHKELKILNKRAEELNSLKKIPKKVLKPLIEREKLIAKRNDLRNLRDHHEAILQTLRTTHPIIEELRSANSHINSEESDMYLDKPGDNEIDDDIKNSEALGGHFHQESAERLAKAGKIKPEDLDEIKKDHVEKKSSIKKFMDTYDRYINCMRGEK